MGEPGKAQKHLVAGTHTAAADQAPGGAAELGALPELVGAEDLGVEDLLPLAIPEAARRGVGRPAGSRNLRSEKTARMLVARYGDPLAASIAIGNMSLPDFVTWLRTVASERGMRVGKDVGVFDLLRFQEECRRNVMPFIHGKRAQTDDTGAVVVPVIGIGSVNVQVNAAPGAGARSIEDAIDAEAVEIRPEQNQGDSDDASE